MKVILFALLAAVAVAVPLDDHWGNFKVTFEKQYQDKAEENFRKGLFLERLRHFEEHNKKFEQGLVTYSLGVNALADATEEELYVLTHGVRIPDVVPASESTYQPPDGYQAPDSFDWRQSNVIPAVKNQGGCGSCWAFSSIGALEAHLAIHLGQTVSLSEQNLVDCTKNVDSGNLGCGGGWMNGAYEYIEENGGIDTEDSYPYEATDGSCRYNPDNRGAGVTGHVNIRQYNEDDMRIAVAERGPLAVAIDVSGDWSYYNGGVYYNPDCHDQPGQLGHAVVVIGYGNENGQDYWLIRNSWGPTFGPDGGYMKMSRNRGNNCGIASVASFPTV